MNIRIENFPPGITLDSEDIEDILLSDAGNSDSVIAMVKLSTGHTGATAIAEYIDGRFYGERRLSARALTLLNE